MSACYAVKNRCLRCGKLATLNGWECASCFELFGDFSERDLPYVIEGLDEDERSLSKAADRPRGWLHRTDELEVVVVGVRERGDPGVRWPALHVVRLAHDVRARGLE